MAKTTTHHTTKPIESSGNSSVVIGLIVGIILSLLTVAGMAIVIVRMNVRNQNSNQTPPNQEQEQQQQAVPDEFGSSVLADGRPRRREDLLYENHDQAGELYYSRAGNYNSRENSVDYI